AATFLRAAKSPMQDRTKALPRRIPAWCSSRPGRPQPQSAAKSSNPDETLPAFSGLRPLGRWVGPEKEDELARQQKVVLLQSRRGRARRLPSPVAAQGFAQRENSTRGQRARFLRSRTRYQTPDEGPS